MQFDGWSNGQRRPLAIYADFEALLVKCDEIKGKKTAAFQKQAQKRYGVFVKAS